MPSYAPLPRIELDPRTEAELVKAAARRVYEASASTLNDFSSGSPIMALLEGQSFAQAEFLQFANQFPESVLVEWIGPFLGAQRRTGAGASVDIKFTIAPRDQAFEVSAGYQVGTDANLTGGESIKFVTLDRLTIPAGQIEGTVRAIAIEKGRRGNVVPGTITKTLTSLSGVKSVTNPQAAYGGQNVELLSEVKERFFTLIRRRNPVSAEDWIDWFSDALGVGTTVSVLPRHSERGTYSYEADYVRSNPSVSFYVLNPDGSPITTTQKDALETLMKWSLPIEFLGNVYPMEVNDVDINIDLEYDSAKPYSQNLQQLSGIIRNSLFSVMTPNSVFPIQYDPSVLDVQNALSATFPITLGVGNRFTDPNIKDIKVYHSPTDAGVNKFVNVAALEFETGTRFKQGDLVIEYTGEDPYFYEVLQDFDPYLNNKVQYVNLGHLEMTHIRELVPGAYNQGDVISFPGPGTLHVVLQPFQHQPDVNPNTYIRDRKLSLAKSFTPLENEVKVFNSDGDYDPDILSVTPSDFKTEQYVGYEPAYVPTLMRYGHPVLVAKGYSFFVDSSNNTLGDAQANGNVSRELTEVRLLTDGESYVKGEFVKTPNDREVATGVLNEDTCYLTPEEGVKEEFFVCKTDFEFVLSESNYTNKVEDLILSDFVSPADVVGFTECGRSAFRDRPFRYMTRFRTGEYVSFREAGGFNSSELEECFQQSEKCSEVSGPCKELLEAQLPLPRHFQAKKDFTPYTTSIDKLISDGFLFEVGRETFNPDYLLMVSFYTVANSENITKNLIDTGLITNVTDLEQGESCEVVSNEGAERGVFRWSGNAWVKEMNSMPVCRDLFRFAPGDVVSLRQESSVKSYRAVDYFSPVFQPDVYIKNGALVQDQFTTANRNWVDPTYHMEDIVYSSLNGAVSFYRVITPVTPANEEIVWNNNEIANTPRIEELKGRFLKTVIGASCGDLVLSRLRDNASSIKLGVTNLKFRSKDSTGEKTNYVWESTQYSSETPVVSFSPTITQWDYKPIDYGNGTLAL